MTTQNVPVGTSLAMSRDLPPHRDRGRSGGAAGGGGGAAAVPGQLVEHQRGPTAGRGRGRGGSDREPRRWRPGGGVGGCMVRFLLHRAVLPVHDPQLG